MGPRHPPFGLPSQSTGGAAAGSTTQPIQWSSEFYDSELALIYYNHRHYNPVDGRWIQFDYVDLPQMLYLFAQNSPVKMLDIIGLTILEVDLRYKPEFDDSPIALTYIENKYEAMKTKIKAEFDCREDSNNTWIFVSKIEEPTWIIVKKWPKYEDVSNIYTKKGYNMVIKHEERRLTIYKKAHSVYVDIVLNNVKKLIYNISDEKKRRKDAERLMQNYINIYYGDAVSDALFYIEKQQAQISKEHDKDNLIYSDNLVDGIKFTHVIDAPPPTAVPPLHKNIYFIDSIY